MNQRVLALAGWLSIGLLWSGALSAHPAAAPQSVARHCADAATRFGALLAGRSREHAMQPFAANLRSQWSYRAGAAFRQQGLRTGDMSDEQRSLFHELLRCGLSSRGYLKTTGVMQLDEVVRARATQIVMYDGKSPVEMGLDYYWLTLFGTPGPAPWGFSVEGHHLTLNFTVVGKRMAATPAFWGAWPAIVETGAQAGNSLLAAEEQAAFDLLAALDERQRARAIVSATKPRGIYTSPERETALTSFEGIPASQLSAAQQVRLFSLVTEYLGNFSPEIADEWLATIRNDGLDRLHFAWMGPGERGQAVYYRIHGPSLLVEFDHSFNITSKALEPDPNHIHALLRRPGADLGADLLAEHYAQSPEHRASE